MMSAGVIYPSSQPRQLVMKKGGFCYIFHTRSTINNDNANDFEEQPVSRTYQYRKTMVPIGLYLAVYCTGQRYLKLFNRKGSLYCYIRAIRSAPKSLSYSDFKSHFEVMKPMLERKRRARINRCLDELRELMLSALQSEGENVSKLEKADILELTVRHLHKLKHQKILKISADGDRFLAGFTHCATEVSQYLGILLQSKNFGIPSRRFELSTNQSSGVKLLQHLQSCMQRIEIASNRRQNTANLHSTLSSSPLPDTSHFHSTKVGSTSTYVSTLERSVWRPW